MTDDNLGPPAAGISRERAEGLHTALDEVLAFFPLFENATDDEARRGWARVLVTQVAGLVPSICGPEVLAAGYGSTSDDGDRSDSLRRLAGRVQLASTIFGSCDDPRDPASLARAAGELFALSGGDDPQIFRKIGDRKVPYRVALAKLRALEWDAYLCELGEAASSRHAKIGAAFGQEWDTISRWGTQVSGILGELGDYRLHVAKLSGQRGRPLLPISQDEDLDTALSRDGLALRQAAWANRSRSDEKA